MRSDARAYWRAALRVALTLIVCLVTPALTPSAALAGEAPAVDRVDSIAMTVGDLERSVDFYTHVLSFEFDLDREVLGEDYERLFGLFGVRLRVATLHLGNERLQLLQFLTPSGRPIPPDLHSNDRAFQHIAIVVSDMQLAFKRLRSFKVQYASTAPQRLPESNTAAAGIEAFYFRDPDGHFLELLSFPEGKGAQKWHLHGGPLFLGIDHTAIVVSDTEASLHFYRDLLGLRVAGESENFGTEQEHLNNVFGAHLRITSLRAQQGPGVELLEYLAPQSGRPMPPDTAPADLWYWQINLRSANLAELAQRLQGARTPLTAGKVIELHDGAMEFSAAILARDPDGHRSLIGH